MSNIYSNNNNIYKNNNNNKKSSRFTLVEDVLGVDNNRWWFSLPPAIFKGYEVSNDGYVRSMKHYKKYPCGLLIKPRTNKDGTIINPQDPIFELSNTNNDRVYVHYSQLLDMVRNYPAECTPTRTSTAQGSVRTPTVFTTHNKKKDIHIDKDEYPVLNFSKVFDDKNK